MSAWLDEVVSEERLLLPGHAACAGCGPAINIRHVLGALAAAQPETKTVLVIPASCWTIIAGIWPVNAFKRRRPPDPVRLGGRGGVGDQGGAPAARARRHERRRLGRRRRRPATSASPAVSAAAERNEDILYVLNDNEAYMNTGVQKSGATPEGAWTTTTPAGARAPGQKKDIARIMAAHGIPYVATLAAGLGADAPGLPDEGRAGGRGARASASSTCSAPARPAGGTRPAESTEITRLAVESRYFPLFECDDGDWRITFRPKHEVPVGDFLATQGRFAHLTPRADRHDPGARRRPLEHLDEPRGGLMATQELTHVEEITLAGPDGAVYGPLHVEWFAERLRSRCSARGPHRSPSRTTTARTSSSRCACRASTSSPSPSPAPTSRPSPPRPPRPRPSPCPRARPRSPRRRPSGRRARTRERLSQPAEQGRGPLRARVADVPLDQPAELGVRRDTRRETTRSSFRRSGSSPAGS